MTPLRQVLMLLVFASASASAVGQIEQLIPTMMDNQAVRSFDKDSSGRLIFVDVVAAYGFRTNNAVEFDWTIDQAIGEEETGNPGVSKKIDNPLFWRVREFEKEARDSVLIENVGSHHGRHQREKSYGLEHQGDHLQWM